MRFAARFFFLSLLSAERCWFGQRVNIFSHIFATLRLRGRPGRDGCQLKVHCGTVLGAKLHPCWKCVPPKQSHNALWQPSWPGLRATSKWRIRSLQLTRLGDSLSRDHCIVPTLFEKSCEHHLHDIILLFQAFGISENFPLRNTLTRNCNKY